MTEKQVMPVWPLKKDFTGNPYRADVATIDDFESGYIRIEPPCHFAEDTLESISHDVGVSVFNEVEGSEATLYEFVVDQETTFSKTVINRVIYTIQENMLSRLGMIANKELL